MVDITGGAGPNTGLRSGSGGAPPLGTGGTFVATTAGPVNLTGTTNETNMVALKIPANTIGKNGVIELTMLWAYPNSANLKTMVARYNQAAGAVAGGSTGNITTGSTTASAQMLVIIRNNNATNNQAVYGANPSTPFGTSTAVVGTTLAVDTTQDSYINVNGQLALGTETLTLQHARVVVYPHA